MIWAQLAVLFLKLANGFLSRLDKNDIVQSGVDKQILAEWRELNRGLKIVGIIANEPSTPESDLDELRRSGGA